MSLVPATSSLVAQTSTLHRFRAFSTNVTTMVMGTRTSNMPDARTSKPETVHQNVVAVGQNTAGVPNMRGQSSRAANAPRYAPLVRGQASSAINQATSHGLRYVLVRSIGPTPLQNARAIEQPERRTICINGIWRKHIRPLARSLQSRDAAIPSRVPAHSRVAA